MAAPALFAHSRSVTKDACPRLAAGIRFFLLREYL